MTPDFPEAPDNQPDDANKDFDEALWGQLDFDLPEDFVVPDDLSELDSAPPALLHEGTDGRVWGEGQTSPLASGDTLPQPSIAEAAALESELAGITGEQLDLAVLVTPIVDAKALAGACAILGLNAVAVPTELGALAVLLDASGQTPVQAAKALGTVIPNLPILLIMKSAGQLQAQRFVDYLPPQDVPAGLIVAGASAVLEDLLVGQVDLNQLRGTVSSVGVPRAKALMWLAGATRRGKRK
jgi:hypothetical protein